MASCLPCGHRLRGIGFLYFVHGQSKRGGCRGGGDRCVGAAIMAVTSGERAGKDGTEVAKSHSIIRHRSFSMLPGMPHLMREDECPQTSGGWLVPHLNCVSSFRWQSAGSLSAPNGSNAAQSPPTICALM
jgi:hypothetical protein